MSPVRVAIDMRLAGYRAGGIARYAEELHQALARHPDVTPIPLRSRRDRTDDGAPRMRTPPHHRMERYSIGAELLLSRVRPDVYHATDFVAPRLPGIATVATVHDLEFIRHPEYLDTDGLRYYQQIRASSSWTDAWITPSRWTAGELEQALSIDPDSITVIPHGPPGRVSGRLPVARDQRSPHLLIVGTLEPRKRHHLVLDALGLLDDAPPLVLVGNTGWRSDNLVHRLERTSGVTCLRGIDDAQLWDLYRNAFAVAIPSESEGFGLVALEAMAAGTPVISSGHGALPEVTGLAAIVPESDDPEGWALAIQRLIDDEHLWNELAVFGQRRAREFSWDRAARSTADVYRKVASR